MQQQEERRKNCTPSLISQGSAGKPAGVLSRQQQGACTGNGMHPNLNQQAGPVPVPQFSRTGLPRVALLGNGASSNSPGKKGGSQDPTAKSCPIPNLGLPVQAMLGALKPRSRDLGCQSPNQNPTTRTLSSNPNPNNPNPSKRAGRKGGHWQREEANRARYLLGRTRGQLPPSGKQLPPGAQLRPSGKLAPPSGASAGSRPQSLQARVELRVLKGARIRVRQGYGWA